MFALVGALAIGIGIYPLGDILVSMVTVSRAHQNLIHRADAREIGAAMAAALQNEPLSPKRLIDGTDPDLPGCLRNLNPARLALDPDHGAATLEFDGGFYHYGYRIDRQGDRFRMICYGENDGDITQLGVSPIPQSSPGP